MVIHDELADFGAFYERTYHRAFGVALGMTGERGLAEDVTQDAFVSAFRERSRFRGEGSADAWMYRIVVNTATSALRRRRVRLIVPLDPTTDQGSVDAGFRSALDHGALMEGLQRLDARARSAILLRYYLDLDYATMARILRTSPSNVGVILTRARERLRLLLAATADERRHESPVRKVALHG